MDNRKTFLLWIGCLVVGVVFILLTKPMIGNFAQANGKPLLAFFIPLPLCIGFFSLICWFRPIVRKDIGLGILLFLLLISPLYNYFFQGYEHLPQDDASRYLIVAENIAHNKTLWGSDDLIFGTDRKVYMVQPGYRYYLAGWIGLFGKENRLFQLFNMLVYLGSIVVLLTKLGSLTEVRQYRKAILAFILLSSPFVAKLIMMGLMEWLVAALLCWTVYFYTKAKKFPTVILLALLPFFRQNLLIYSLLLFGWIAWNFPEYKKYIPVYLLLLFLPLYHNLYYAGQWKFFATYYDRSGYLVLDFEGSEFLKLVKTFFYHILLYAGVDWMLPNFLANLLSLLFIPLGTVLYFFLLLRYRGRNAIWFAAISLSAIIPTLIFGGRAYYPRFEWLNLFSCFMAFVILRTRFERLGSGQNN